MNAARRYACWFLMAALTFLSAAHAEYSGGGSSGGGRGGIFAEFHTSSIAAFDSALAGNPIVIGGEGVGYVSKNFRLGGGGGAGFIWNPGDTTHFGMGYGGLIGEYVATNWLSFNLMIGGGGYAVSRVVSSDATSTVINQVSSNGFLLVKPSLKIEFPIGNSLRGAVSVALFLPNVSQLTSVTVGFHLIFGRS